MIFYVFIIRFDGKSLTTHANLYTIKGSQQQSPSVEEREAESTKPEKRSIHGTTVEGPSLSDRKKQEKKMN